MIGNRLDGDRFSDIEAGNGDLFDGDRFLLFKLSQQNTLEINFEIISEIKLSKKHSSKKRRTIVRRYTISIKSIYAKRIPI